MAEDKSKFMMRAFELARHGAGIVSPNPMVGAVLVKEGRIVGEGYHLYEKLKHAETYAIEMAGEQARGATLYCNLEPCCHHGRTSPCTDALIEAGISRAVIAIRDSDPRVNGRGIEQLKAAGIEVDVDVCQKKALRINESYFKFVSKGIPFVHGAVIHIIDGYESLEGWTPSREFLDLASEYDALVLGCESGPNRELIEACLKRPRHRPPIIAGTPGALRSITFFAEDLVKAKASLFVIASRKVDRTGIAKKLLDFWKEAAIINPDLASILQALVRLRATSCTIMADSRDRGLLGDLTTLDKLTLVVRGENESDAIRSMSEWDDLVIGLDGVEYWQTGRHTEIIGYPRECEIDPTDPFYNF